MSVRSGDAEAVKKAVRVLSDKSETISRRASVALVLAEQGNKQAKSAVEAIFKSGGNESLKRALLPAVAKFDDHKIVSSILDGWESRIAGDTALREAALRMMAGKKEWSAMLLGEVDRWRVPVKHFNVDIVRQLSLHKDEDIDAAIERHWKGLLAVAPTEELLKEGERIKAVLRSGTGDLAAGKLLFAQRCAICHKLFGEGNDVGPDLTGYERGSLEFWLTAMLSPSIEIREGYGNYIVRLKSGQIMTGIIANQDASGVTLRDAANQLTQVKQADIGSLEASPVSLMPPMLTAGLSDADLRSLFAYMMKAE